ncbi:MAG: tyrosine-protein phosphatase [Caulobacteraceae bacterium]|nr:tyrosine-protein phosphatase [Caulobacteraceae bacterium]
MDRRRFLTGAVAGGVLAAAGEALAAPMLEGRATRVSGGALRLDWTGARTPVSIYVSDDPDAPRWAMRELRSAVRGGGADLALTVSPRPYLLLVARGGAQTRVAERLLPLQGGRNFRDLGGYRAADGRQVRWGRIFRSGVMSGLTEADIAYLARLGLKVVCDLRSSAERTSEPSPFLKSAAPQVAAFDYEMAGSIEGLGRARNRDEAVAAFASAYVDFLQVLAPHYTDMFARLVRGQTPLAVNCSAGKDRTGVASALILSVLGVPRETVVADYALSQTYTPVSYYRDQMAGAAKAGDASARMAQAFAHMPPDVVDVILGSDPQVMRLTLARIDRQFGGPVALAKARFGLTDATIARLRSVYLT